MTWQAKTTVQVFGTTLNQVLCSVPNRLEITAVDSTGLESWELADDPDNADATLITLNYRQPFDGSREITFRGVMAAAVGEAWTVPTLTISNVTSHVGRIVVQHPAGVRVRAVELDGVRAVSGEAGSLTYGVWREDFRLSFETRTRQRELHTGVSTILNLHPAGITFHGEIDFESFAEPLFEIRFRLPAEWEVESVTVGGEPSLDWKLVTGDDGWNEYRVPLKKAIPPGTEQKFVFHARQPLEDWKIEEDAVELAIPAVQIPEATVLEGTLVILAGNDLALETLDLEGLDPVQTGETGERLGYQFQSAEHAGTLIVSRKPSQITAQTIAFTRLDREVLQSHVQIQIDVLGGGVRTLQPETDCGSVR